MKGIGLWFHEAPYLFTNIYTNFYQSGNLETVTVNSTYVFFFAASLDTNGSGGDLVNRLLFYPIFTITRNLRSRDISLITQTLNCRGVVGLNKEMPSMYEECTAVWTSVFIPLLCVYVCVCLHAGVLPYSQKCQLAPSHTGLFLYCCICSAFSFMKILLLSQSNRIDEEYD